MGCGITNRGPQRPLYTNEFSPPCHELVMLPYGFPEIFPPSGVIPHEKGCFFDDREFIKQCQIVHIFELAVYIENYVTGIEVSYFIDGGVKVLKHLGTKLGKKHVLPLQNSDSIINIEGTSDQSKIKSLKIDTIEGKNLTVISSTGPSSEKFSLELKTQRRGVIAFKGRVEEYLEGLRVYSWRLVLKKGS